MRRAGILGLGQVSAAGAGLDALRRALAGATPRADWIATLPGIEPLPFLRARASGLERFVQPRQLRRVDPFSQRALLAAFLALEDAGFRVEAPARVGAVLATGYGPLSTSFAFLDEVIDKGDGLGSPIHFANSVHNAPTALISTLLHVEGPILTLTGFAHAFAQAVSVALGWLERGEVDHAIVASADEVHPMLAYGVARLSGAAPTGELDPLDFARCGYVAGETFTAMLLGRPGEARHATIEEPTPFAATAESAAGAAATDDDQTLFLAAQGDAREGQAYLAAASRAREVACYGALWGGSPTAEAMTILTAAISLSDGFFYTIPGHPKAATGLRLLAPGPLGERRAVRCVTLDAGGRGTSIMVRRRREPTAPASEPTNKFPY